jgi:hypothetical protein
MYMSTGNLTPLAGKNRQWTPAFSFRLAGGLNLQAQLPFHFV